MVDLRDPPPPCSGQVPDRNGKTILTLSQQKKLTQGEDKSFWMVLHGANFSNAYTKLYYGIKKTPLKLV